MSIPSYNGWAVNTGRYIPSGSHCGTARSFISGGGGTRININVKNYNAGGCYGNDYVNPFMGGYYGGGYYGDGGGIRGKDILALGAVGLGVGIGIKHGGTILKGIGQAASWTWNSVLKPFGTWTFNNILKPVGKGIGEFFTRCKNLVTGKGWTKDASKSKAAEAKAQDAKKTETKPEAKPDEAKKAE